MTALSPGEIRARRRPGVLLSVAAARMLAGFCLAWPLTSMIDESGVGLRSEGDRALFEGGGYFLLELLRLRGGDLSAAARGLLPVLGLGLVLTAGCNSALLMAINSRQVGRWRELVARASVRLPALVVVGASTTLAQGVLVVAGLLTSSALPESLTKPVAASVGQGALWLLVAATASALGGFSDVVKASVVRHESRLGDAFGRAWRCVQHQPFRAAFGWVPWAAPFLMTALVAGEVSQLCDVSRAGAWRVGCVFVAHQLVVLSAVAARAAWFARTLRLVATDA